MTKPRYPQGCAAGSKERGKARAPSPGDYAWNVNFNNGNANYNNQSDDGFVRAVRAGECQGATSFRDLHAAWRAARRGKKPSANQLTFDALWSDRLLDLQADLNACTWRPSPPTCFIAKRPKAREIHAPDFADRVVHHWLVPQLEAIYEPTFIHDCYSNRKDKGAHAAVERLRAFVRQVEDGKDGGWYLQLDVFNFFNSIHRPTLYAMLRRRIAYLPLATRRAVHALLRASPARAGVHYVCTAAERASVPAHKQLANAVPGCGIAIGNLSSQFFANVYLDALDQFVKHGLRARRYLRYVDDFVLIHESREQLEVWRGEIERFLFERLRLALKPGARVRPISAGIDFLGYVIHPRHVLVRRRVIHHAREALSAWGRQHVHSGRIVATPEEFRTVRSIAASYAGHFAHANTHRLRCGFARRFPWLAAATAPRSFDHRLEGQQVAISFGRERAA